VVPRVEDNLMWLCFKFNNETVSYHRNYSGLLDVIFDCRINLQCMPSSIHCDGPIITVYE